LEIDIDILRLSIGMPIHSVEPSPAAQVVGQVETVVNFEIPLNVSPIWFFDTFALAYVPNIKIQPWAETDAT